MRYRKIVFVVLSISLAVASLFAPRGSLVLASISSAVMLYSFGITRFLVGSLMLLILLAPSKMSFDFQYGYLKERDFETLEGSRSFENIERLKVYGKGVKIVGDLSKSGVNVSGGMRFKITSGDLELASNHGGRVVLGKCGSISIYGMGISTSGYFAIESLEIYGMSNDIRGNFEGLGYIEIDGIANDVDMKLNSSRVSVEINGTSNDVRLDLTGVESGDLKIEVDGTSNDVVVILSKDSKVHVRFEGNPSFLNDFRIRRK